MAFHRTREIARAAGLWGSATLVVLTAALHTLAPVVAFPPVALAQSLVGAPSGGFDSYFINLLGHWAARLTVVTVTALYGLSGLFLGPLAARIARKTPVLWLAAFLPLWVVAAVLYTSPPPSLSRLSYAGATSLLYVVAGATSLFAFQKLEATHKARAAAAPASSLSPTITGSQPGVGTGPGRLTPVLSVDDLTRRNVLRALTVGAGGAALGLANLGGLLFPPPDPARRVLSGIRVSPVSGPSPAAGDRAFARIAGLTPEITPVPWFYVVDKELIDPVIDASTWGLSVRGLVERPLRLSYAELLSLPAVERYQTLECISNEVGGGLMSTALWTGVPLPLILHRARLRPKATTVVFRCAGGYSESLPLDKAMEDTTLIAIGMNRRALPRSHGFPARLLSVGTYGMKNPKWLTDIEVVDHPYVGYWEARGWAAGAPVATTSRIDVPSDGATVEGMATVAGVAFAGDRGVSRVEVSADGGGTWHKAQLKTPLSPYTWRLWMYTWRPQESGSRSLGVRAVDGAGTPQASVAAAPFPSGATGLLSESVNVTL